ncbi:indole-3-glycerol phosphate synthase TrpC [Sediminitomix flava]|uniref:Indole-3-glycerol phosphate synthase n=1 Tax=Sediminitomix flava TaxID=379075 RepID=A0A315Z798_SEDFL|nr:indole-3-glycerol phosphate synthase TrpC [Sediminitomix flava]PWJ40102.1 indole-3-glycerol phosphate synthase [Sediminitomix flava]
MDILEKIIARKEVEVAEAKARVSVSQLEHRPMFDKAPFSATKWLRNPNKTGIIAEFKRRSPSKGLINGESRVVDVAEGYLKAGVSAMSVLTDTDFFGGTFDDLCAARTVVDCPILRKDFMIDEYQILEAKSFGADIILLIAAAISPQRLKELAQFAQNLGMETLLEVHDEQELNTHFNPYINLVGVNNRNLKTFEVSVETSIRLAELIPNNCVKISESGISDPKTIKELKKYGYQGFLIGENFMKTNDPAAAIAEFVKEL